MLVSSRESEGTLKNTAVNQAKHLPILLPGSCDRIRFCIELGEMEPRILISIRRKIWQRIAKGNASADEHDLFERIDVELSRYSNNNKTRRGLS
jgi:hypothetical protein